MSYTRNHSATVSGSKTVSVSYPASERGGSTSVTVDIDIPVAVLIEVDTRPLDSSVGHCRHTVDALTGAVVATGTANVAAIKRSANQIAASVTQGFFSLISSEVSQQMTEFGSHCEALFLKLEDLKKACLAKKLQMEQDFHRKASQYTTLFDDLDRELTRRIQMLDAAVFGISALATLQNDRAFSSTASAVPLVSGTEDGRNRSALMATAIRRRVMDALRTTASFLAGSRKLAENLKYILTGEIAGVGERALPVIYMKADGPGSGVEKLVSGSALITPAISERITARMCGAQSEWKPIDSREHAIINSLLTQKTAEQMASGDPKQGRVSRLILALWQSSAPLVFAPVATEQPVKD